MWPGVHHWDGEKREAGSLKTQISIPRLRVPGPGIRMRFVPVKYVFNLVVQRLNPKEAQPAACHSAESCEAEMSCQHCSCLGENLGRRRQGMLEGFGRVTHQKTPGGG